VSFLNSKFYFWVFLSSENVAVVVHVNKLGKDLHNLMTVVSAPGSCVECKSFKLLGSSDVKLSFDVQYQWDTSVLQPAAVD
jgi:hypothetical protein